MNEIIALITKYTPLFAVGVGAVMALVFKIKQRQLRSLQIELLERKQIAETNAIRVKLLEAEAEAEKARKFYENARNDSIG